MIDKLVSHSNNNNYYSRQQNLAIGFDYFFKQNPNLQTEFRTLIETAHVGWMETTERVSRRFKSSFLSLRYERYAK